MSPNLYKLFIDIPVKSELPKFEDEKLTVTGGTFRKFLQKAAMFGLEQYAELQKGMTHTVWQITFIQNVIQNGAFGMLYSSLEL